jgi:hypothetical protein
MTPDLTLVRAIDVAKELDIAPETLSRWRSAGKGPKFIKEGAFVRYARCEIDAFKTATVAV